MVLLILHAFLKPIIYDITPMQLDITTDGAYKYVEVGEGKVLLLLHGLFGSLSNFEDMIAHFAPHYRVVMPFMPILEMSPRELSVEALVDFIDGFVAHKGFDKVNVLGNSLGGHVTLLYTVKRPERINTMILTGSSGLFENAFGSSFPKRGDYEFIKARIEFTFYDPATASKALVDEVFEMVNDRAKAMNIIVIAKSAIRHNLGNLLHKITVPTSLIWGNQDNITPPFVGEDFHKNLVNSELHFIDLCGHAPMMEQPAQFCALLEPFLAKHN